MSNQQEQEIKGEINDEFRLSDKIIFRDSKSLGSEMIQIIVLVVTLAFACFITYIVIIMVGIFIYHILYDNDPKKIPKFIKESPQFSMRLRAIKRKKLEWKLSKECLKKNKDKFNPDTGDIIRRKKVEIEK